MRDTSQGTHEASGYCPTKSDVKITRRDLAENAVEGHGGLLALAILSLVVGAASGLSGAAFRLSIEQADHWRDNLVGWAHRQGSAGPWLVAAACAIAASVAAWLVRRHSPYASGSGIPHVEAVMNQELPQAPYRLIPIKFFGGILAMGSGLALGREGPTIQIGASIAHMIGKMFKRNWPDCRNLLAAGAGAGLATAFNAPIAGMVFVLEELSRQFETRMTIATFGASVAAITVARVFLGQSPDFEVEPLAHTALAAVPLFIILGFLAGLVGVAYNRSIIGAMAVAQRVHRCPVEVRAALIGAVVGLIAWQSPGLVGGGENITQQLITGNSAITLVPLAFALRFSLGAVSYATGTPGGLFAPMLVLGAQLGLLFGTLSWRMFPGITGSPVAFAVVGMAAFFASVVRAPLTGIILVSEMTGCYTQLLPMLGACFTAMLVPTLVHNPPIYDALKPRSKEFHEHL